MLSCVPRVIVATADYIINLSYYPANWEEFFNEHPHVYVHFPTLLKRFKNKPITDKKISRIITMWENDQLIAIPHGDGVAELPAIVSLDARYPDNVKVFCATFGEYAELRKNFSREDIGGF